MEQATATLKLRSRARSQTVMADSIRLKDDKHIAVKFGGNSPDFQSKLAAIRSLPEDDRQFEGKPREWVIAVDHLAAILRMFPSIQIDPALRERMEQAAERQRRAAEQRAQEQERLRGAVANMHLERPLPGGLTLYKHQVQAAERMAVEGRIILADEMGLGKAQPLTAKVLTPNGWKLMGEIQVGDCVINSQGKTSHVLGVYPQGEKDIYRISFSDGSSTECCADHLWLVQSPNHRFRGTPGKIKTTRELMDDLHAPSGNHRWFIPIVQPVEFNEAPLPLPAYLVGLLIGDGHLRQHATYLSCAEPELLDIVARLLPKRHWLQRTSEDQVDYRITTGNTGNRVRNQVTGALNQLGLSGCRSQDKFLPDVYKFASVQSRIELLRGLLDTDGYVNGKDGNIEYNTVSPRLADDVQFLVESLGGKARIAVKHPTFTHKGEKRNGQLCYRMNISVPPTFNPFRLTRKANAYRPKSKYKPFRAIAKIEWSRCEEAQCILVDAPDHLYVTDHCIVTHNTLSTLAAAKLYQQLFGCYVWVICPVSLKENWKREAALAGVEIEVFSWAKVPPPTPTGRGYVLICDEAHYAQTLTSIRTKAMLALAEDAKAVYLISGTPMKNGRPANLFPLLKACGHRLAKDRKKYEQYFCEAGPTRFSRWDASGAAHLDELHKLTRDIILRRTKDQCLDLPPKTRVLRQAELSDAAKDHYQHTLDTLRARYQERVEKGEVTGGAEAVVELGFLRHAASLAKVETTTDLALQVMSEGSPIVVFTAFRDTADLIAAELGAEVLDGETKPRDRQPMVDRFQAGTKQAIVCTFGAGGVGITLHAASNVILSDRPWTPGDAQQSEDRLHRIGQHHPVTAHWIQAFEVDRAIDAILLTKQERIDLVMQGKRKTLRGAGGSPADIARELLPILLEK